MAGRITTPRIVHRPRIVKRGLSQAGEVDQSGSAVGRIMCARPAVSIVYTYQYVRKGGKIILKGVACLKLTRRELT